MSGVVKARVTLEVLLPSAEAYAFERMSLETIFSNVENGVWIAGPMQRTKPAPLGKAEFDIELAKLRSIGCHFDDDDVKALAGAARWWDAIRTLDDMVACKDRFLADPGCEFDLDEMSRAVHPRGVGSGDDVGESGIPSANFDRVVALFSGLDTLVVHRMVPASGADEFVDAACRAGDGLSELICAEEEAVGAAGGHWSLAKDTSCPDSGNGSEDVLLTGEVDAADVDWFSTFQAAFSRPWEMYVGVGGEPRLTRVLDVYAGVHHDPEPGAAPGMR